MLKKIRSKLVYIVLRISAFFLDLLLVGGISITFAYYLADDRIPFPVHFVMCFAAICAFCEAGPWQATPGKKILGLKVVGKQGESLHILNASLRRAAWLVGFIPIVVSFFFEVQYQVLLGLIGLTLFLFSFAVVDKLNRSLPDMISRNKVVRNRPGFFAKTFSFALVILLTAYSGWVYHSSEGEIEMIVTQVKKLKNVGAIKAAAMVFASQFIELDLEEVVKQEKTDAPPEDSKGFTVATASSIQDRVFAELMAVDPYEVGVYVNRNLVHHRRYGGAPKKYIIDLKPWLRFGNNFIAVRAKVAGRIKTSQQIRQLMQTDSFRVGVFREYDLNGKKELLTTVLGPGPEVKDGEWNYTARKFVIEEEVDLTKKMLVDAEDKTGRKVSSLDVDNTQYGVSRFKKFFFGSWTGKKQSASGHFSQEEAMMELKVTENEYEYSIGTGESKKFVYNSKNTAPGVYSLNIYSGTVRESIIVTRRGPQIKVRRQNGDIFILERSK